MSKDCHVTIEVIMRKSAIFVVVAGLSLPMPPLVAAQTTGTATQPQTVVGRTVLDASLASQAVINGTVVTPNGQPLANTAVRARNLLTGEIGGSTTTSTGGQFSIRITPGSYVLEIVDEGGQIVGTSAFISAAPGTAAMTVTVTATSGVLGALSAAPGLVATLGSSAARSVTFAAAAAGVAGVVRPPDVQTASPSR